MLAYNHHSITGSGSTASDNAIVKNGYFGLNFALTRLSNVSNDDLAGAVAIVTQSLTSLGY